MWCADAIREGLDSFSMQCNAGATHGLAHGIDDEDDDDDEPRFGQYMHAVCAEHMNWLHVHLNPRK